MVSEPSHSGSDITLHDVLTHLLSLGRRMDEKFHRVNTRLDSIERRLDSVEYRLGDIEGEMRFMRTGIQNLDARLDTIELIPAILKHIKAH